MFGVSAMPERMGLRSTSAIQAANALLSSRACDLICKYTHCSNMKVTQKHMARGNNRFKTQLYIIYIMRILIDIIELFKSKL
jgi:hypothetical protein